MSALGDLLAGLSGAFGAVLARAESGLRADLSFFHASRRRWPRRTKRSGRVNGQGENASGGVAPRVGAAVATALLLGCLQDLPYGFGVGCSSDDDCAGELRCLELEYGVICTEDRCLTMACQTPCASADEDEICGEFSGYCGCNEFGACEYGDCK